MLAIRSLSSKKEQGAKIVPALFKILQKDPAVTVRFAAADAIGKLQALPAQSIPHLQQALSDKGWPVQVASAVSLKRFGKTAIAAIPALETLWNSRKQHWLARKHALETYLALESNTPKRLLLLSKGLQKETDRALLQALIVFLGNEKQPTPQALHSLLKLQATKDARIQKKLWDTLTRHSSFLKTVCPAFCSFLAKETDKKRQQAGLSWLKQSCLPLPASCRTQSFYNNPAIRKQLQKKP